MRSPKRQKVEEEESKWSKLYRDVLEMVFERLSAADFDRSKAVCSAWRSISRETMRKQNRIPWLILFPYERSYRYSCRMLNPIEKGLVYRSRSLGVEFTQSRCMATCGSWLLMYNIHHQRKLYILNPLTREKINLPPLESRKNDFIISPDDHPQFDRPSDEENALKNNEMLDLSTEVKLVLWVDDNSKDYLVVWSYDRTCLFFSKRGDDFWRMFPYPTTGCRDLVYKPHKLYVFTGRRYIEVYDFSGNSPVVVTNLPNAYRFASKYIATRIVVTPSGEVLMVRCYYNHPTSKNFYIYKMNHDTQMWDHMPSLGDQALILDLGITVSTKDIQGLKADSIYFSGHDFGTNHIFIFNLATGKVETFMSSTNKFFDARWFIPSV